MANNNVTSLSANETSTNEASIGGSMLSRTAVGMGWIVAWRMATRLLGLCNTLILVRLLAPADFGLVALGTSFVMAVDTLSTLGLEDALVREAAPTAAMYNTAFTLNALRSVLTALLITAAATTVGGFFAGPRLTDVLWALAAGAVIEGVGSIGVVDFRRDLAFHKEFLLQILPRLIGITFTLAGAVLWHSYWALIAGILAGRVARTAFGYRLHAWRPRPTLVAWRSLIGFSVWSWAVSMTQLARDRMDQFVIGRALNPSFVGVYAIGEELAALPTSELVLPLTRACFSGFAAAGRARHDVVKTFIRPVALTFLVTLPAGLGISMVANPLVRLLVGEQWAAAIPIVELLGVMGAFTVFGYVAATLLSAYGMLRRQFGVMLACLLLRLAVVIPLVQAYGIAGAAAGAFTGMLLEHALVIAIAFRQFDLRAEDLLAQTWRTLFAAAIMTAVLVAAGLGWTGGPPLDPAGRLAAAGALGVASYTLALTGLWLAMGRPAGAEADSLAIFASLSRAVWASSGFPGHARVYHDGKGKFMSPANRSPP